MSDHLQAGVAKRDISPPIGSDLCGYVARVGPSRSQLHPLWAKCLVLQHGNQRIVALFLDLLGLNAYWDQRIKLHLMQQYGIENITIFSSHTHSGPATDLLQGCGETDSQYMTWLTQQINLVVGDALRQLCDVDMAFEYASSSQLASLHKNRRNEHGPIDSSLPVVVFQKKGATEPLAVIYRFTCHPVILGSDSYAISGDWVSYASDAIEQYFANKTMALFVNGPAGNVNPVQRGTIQDARRFGQMVGIHAIKAITHCQRVHVSKIQFHSQAVALELLPLFETENLQQLHSAYEMKIAELQQDEPHHAVQIMKSLRVFANWAANALRHDLGGRTPPPVTVELQLLRLGDIVLLALPGEVFVEYGIAIQEQLGQRIIPCGYANANVGYIPWHDAYDQGGYEVNTAYKYYGYPSAIAPEGGKKLLSAAVQACTSVLDSPTH